MKFLKKNLKKIPCIYHFFLFLYIRLKIVFEFSVSIIFLIFPINNKKIVFISFHGKGFGDNGKYIVNEILSAQKKWDIVWLSNSERIDGDSFPEQVRVVKYGSIWSLYELNTAKVWINNCRMESYLFKRKRQFYIQTWHGGLGIKKIEADAIESLGIEYVKKAKRDSFLADYFISNSTHLSNIYKQSFWFDGDIVEIGYPKNDPLFMDKKVFRKKLRNFYNIDNSKKIFLYAPTFRVNGDLTAYDLDFLKIKENLVGNNDWVFLARLHPNVDAKLFHKIFPEFVIDATAYSDMQELVLGVDSLVTDYSSCMFDSAIAEIPTFIYASDVKKYKEDRDFYFELEELPFFFSDNSDDFVKNFNKFNQTTYLLRLKNFNNKVGLIDDGKSSERFLKFIEKQCISFS